MQLSLNLAGDFRDVVQFMILSMLGKSLRSDWQMAGKVSQIACREQLDRVGIGVWRRNLELLKDRCIAFPVRQEHVVKQGQRCQLLNLTWNRHVSCFHGQGCVVFHFGF